jgi:hypothetical protein
MPSIQDLKPDHKNARRRTDRSSSMIAESLKRFGAARSIVIDENGRVLAGNGTVEGAKAAGITKVRIIEAAGDELIAVQRTDLTEDEKIGLALADNRTSDLSDWDDRVLRQLAEEQDISSWFNQEDLNDLLGDAGGFNFKPNISPTQGAGLNVTDDTISQEQEKLTNQFSSRPDQDLIEITCPHCDEQFTIEKRIIS